MATRECKNEDLKPKTNSPFKIIWNSSTRLWQPEMWKKPIIFNYQWIWLCSSFSTKPPPLISLGSSVTIGLIVLDAHRNNHGTLRENWILHYILSQKAVADPGEASVPLSIGQTKREQTEARRAEKKNLRADARLISGCGWPPHPHLKVWFHHWIVKLLYDCCKSLFSFKWNILECFFNSWLYVRGYF